MALFDMLDLNHDGKITRAELAQLMGGGGASAGGASAGGMYGTAPAVDGGFLPPAPAVYCGGGQGTLIETHYGEAHRIGGGGGTVVGSAPVQLPPPGAASVTNVTQFMETGHKDGQLMEIQLLAPAPAIELPSGPLPPPSGGPPKPAPSGPPVPLPPPIVAPPAPAVEIQAITISQPEEAPGPIVKDIKLIAGPGPIVVQGPKAPGQPTVHYVQGPTVSLGPPIPLPEPEKNVVYAQAAPVTNYETFMEKGKGGEPVDYAPIAPTIIGAVIAKGELISKPETDLCEYCGNHFMDDSLFCRKCGKPRPGAAGGAVGGAAGFGGASAGFGGGAAAYGGGFGADSSTAFGAGGTMLTHEQAIAIDPRVDQAPPQVTTISGGYGASAGYGGSAGYSAAAGGGGGMDLFSMIDVNHDGRITRSELQTAFMG